ncbi:NAD-dependent malic enzyme [Polyangium jinanense]|uniref:NAD-dependent malic enzyme n=1 Tax=Polyangium jinanense TaxID=2829994 RepID=A0A9X3XBD9_9BACT|nr:malic enzyme-like NAD(P)-binding protein [Polyangium jinanense]MDC3956780.1 NAD-dependent malic enzyme [Polyangium jinanense]MDC3987224.1 NAD-dependent malic enzyme [Polyangium jinanense]
MRKTSLDTVLRVKCKHRVGQLARLATVVAEQGGLLGDITTLRIVESDTLREITVETQDEEQRDRVIEAVRAIDGVELIDTIDRVFDLHKGGKLHMTSRIELRHQRDLRYIYTPGVARVARAIEREPERARHLTGIGNSVGIFTNGTRVLGLGNVGPLASLPVMEGKAVLYDKFVGISASPILVDTLDPREFVDTVLRLSLTFGGIHLEDIRIPDCYKIEEELIERLDKPVMHDDQHGTATVALAAVLNACKMTGVSLEKARVGQIGLGAAGSAIARLMMAHGARDVLVTDRSEEAMAWLKSLGAHPVDLPTLMREADIVIAATGRPGLIDPKWIRPGQVIFPLSNPDPEIEPVDALAAGAAYCSDGRSINNALAFPGLFRGALAVESRAITPEMRIAAARAIASCAEKGEVVPSPLLPHVHEAVCEAVVEAARAQGLEGTARLTPRKPSS